MAHGAKMKNPARELGFRSLHAVGKALSHAYYGLFGASERNAAAKLDRTLAADVENQWSALIQAKRGIIKLRERERTNFDYAMCEIEFPRISARVIRGRGELRVQVSPPLYTGEWQDIQHILNVFPPLNEDKDLLAWQEVLFQNWDNLVQTLDHSQ